MRGCEDSQVCVSHGHCVRVGSPANRRVDSRQTSGSYCKQHQCCQSAQEQGTHTKLWWLKWNPCVFMHHTHNMLRNVLVQQEGTISKPADLALAHPKCFILGGQIHFLHSTPLLLYLRLKAACTLRLFLSCSGSLWLL